MNSLNAELSKKYVKADHHKRIIRKTRQMDNKVNKLVSKWQRNQITSVSDSRKLSDEINALIEKFVVCEN